MAQALAVVALALVMVALALAIGALAPAMVTLALVTVTWGWPTVALTLATVALAPAVVALATPGEPQCPGPAAGPGSAPLEAFPLGNFSCRPFDPRAGSIFHVERPKFPRRRRRNARHVILGTSSRFLRPKLGHAAGGRGQPGTRRVPIDGCQHSPSQIPSSPSSSSLGKLPRAVPGSGEGVHAQLELG